MGRMVCHWKQYFWYVMSNGFCGQTLERELIECHGIEAFWSIVGNETYSIMTYVPCALAKDLQSHKATHIG